MPKSSHPPNPSLSVAQWVYTKIHQFNYGTKGVLTAIADSKAFSLAGGGNTIAAIEEYGLTKKIGYISTAGGALIEFLMGKKLAGCCCVGECGSN